VEAVRHRDLSVASVEAKPASRHPSAPFMTSTLQQEASRKFGFGAKATMSAAQRLYEAGHITYMRTDGIDMAPEAVMAARDAIKDRFGADYLPKSPRMYKNKAKNAQERTSASGPTDMTRDAESLRITDADQRKLYDLIWKRTLASQMAEARLERTTVEIGSQDGQVGLRATGQVVLFDGFMAVYTEGRDDPAPGASDAEDDDARLPQVAQGDALQKQAVTPEQHFTQPPPRYTEATLVKRMEELGIGRPSTYASIVTTIQDREYVRKENNRLYPEDKGRLVTIFLTSYFRRYVEYDFTAGLENQLDQVSAGEADYKDVLAASGATSRPRSPRRRTSASARSSTRSTRCSRPTFTPPRGRRRPADLPGLRHRAPVDADLAHRRRVHRLLELPRVPLHPPLRAPVRGRRGRGGRADPGRGGRRADPAQGRPLRPLRAARRGHGRRPQAPPGLAPQGLDAAGHGPRARAAPPVLAACGGRPSRGRRAGGGRDRPLRALREARDDLREPPRRG
jgi:hypothetical protein